MRFFYSRVFVQIPTDEIEEADHGNIFAIATKLRASLSHYLNPSVLQEYMSVAGYLMMMAANKGKGPSFGTEPTTLSVNSNLRFVTLINFVVQLAGTRFSYGLQI